MKYSLITSRTLSMVLGLALLFASSAALAGTKSYLVTIKGPQTSAHLVCKQDGVCPFQIGSQMTYLGGEQIIIPKCPEENGHLPLKGQCKPSVKLEPKKINIGVQINVIIAQPGVVQITRTRLLKMRVITINGHKFQLPETRTCHIGLDFDMGRPVHGCHFTVLVKPMKDNAKG